MNVADKGIKTIRDRYSMVYPRVNPNPGITGRRAARRAFAGRARIGPPAFPRSEGGATLLAIDPIKGAVVGEMRRLRTGPAAENRVDGHERDVRKLGRMLPGDFRIPRSEEMLRRYFLPFLRFQE